MARIRTIKPDFWDSPDTAKASYQTRLFYIAMWNWADDWGIGLAQPKQLVAFAFPNDADVTVEVFPQLAKEVENCFGVVFYEVSGRRYYCIPAWDKHQKTERKAQRVNPTPDEATAPVFAGEYEEPQLAEEEPLLAEEKRTPEREKEREREREKEREEVHTTPTATATKNNEIVDLFDTAYAYWPKRVKREEALTRFKAVAKTQDAPAIAEAIQIFGEAYRATTEIQFVPALGVWLNQKRWDDDLPVAAGAPRKLTATERNAEYVQRLEREEMTARRELTA
jgi:hypothetical protein